MQNHIHNVFNIAQSYGRNILDVEWYDNVYEWLSWYEGKVDDFHNYTQYNGQEFVKRERYSLQMAKIIAEDWATLLFNDRTAIKVDEANQKKLDEILENNNFNENISNLIELCMALGFGAITEYKNAKGEPKMNFVIAPMVFPLRVEDGEIVDCMFASVQSGVYYINIHEKQKNGKYKITNKYVSFTIDGKIIEEEHKEVKDEFISPVKMFQIVKPCIANNIDPFTHFGISVYANAIDRIKACDLVYDSLRNEFVLGKKRLFLREDLVDYKPIVKADGTSYNVPTFDNNDVEFYSLPTDENAGGEQIKEVNSSLRVSDHINGLQSELNMLSDAVGLGNDRYNFQSGNVYTNTTQVISTQSKLYKTLLKHEKVLRRALTDMVKALLYLAKNSEYKGDVTIDFDDSIIEDSAEIQRRALLELQSGIIDKVEYLVQVYKYTEEQAEEFANKIQERQLEAQKAMAEEEPDMENGLAEEEEEEQPAKEEKDQVDEDEVNANE